MEPGVESVPSCPVCGSVKFTTYYTGRDQHEASSPRQYRMSRCLRCRAMFLSDRCPEDQVHAFYGTAYHPYRGGTRPTTNDDYPFSGLRFGPLIRALEWTGMERPLRRAFERANHYADRIGSATLRQALCDAYVPGRPGDLLLDYGCGNADCLNSAQAAGWDTVGVDFTPAVADRVRSAGHRALLVSQVASLSRRLSRTAP